ncbi:MAG: hypothetical protein GXY52_08430 [Chloroflexi bacterium]|nr:hypothetical protein [Chloroflexota bacterium]
MHFWAARLKTALRRAPVVVTLLGGALLVLVLYARAWHFAFWYDDPILHFRQAASYRVIQLALPLEAWTHYRPVGLLLVRVVYGFTKSFRPGILHGIVLFMAAANTFLAGLVVWQRTRSQLLGVLVSLILALNPFAARVATNFMPFFHNLALFFTLIFFVAHWQVRRKPVWIWRVVAYGVLALAVLSHENASVVPVALLIFNVLERAPRARILSDLQYAAVPALYLLVWWLWVPKVTDSNTLAATLRNVPVVLQYLLYPLLPLLPEGSQPVHVLLLAALVLVGGALLLGRSRWMGVWLAAIVWFGLAAAPEVVLLDPDYVSHSTYLGYYGATGVALFWAALIAGCWRWTLRSVRGVLLTVLGVGVLALALLTPWGYIRQTLTDDTCNSLMVRSMRDIALNTPADENLAFVNLPFYWAERPGIDETRRNPYPLFRTVNIVIPPYSDAQTLVWGNGGPFRKIAALRYNGFKPSWVTTGDEISASNLQALVEKAQVYVLDLDHCRFIHLNAHLTNAQPADAQVTALLELIEVPPEWALEEELAACSPLNLPVGEGLSLTCAQALPPAALPGETITLSLFWRVQEHPPADARVRTILRDRYGNVLVEREGALVAGLSVAGWQRERTYKTVVVLDLPKEASLGSATIDVVVSATDGAILAEFPDMVGVLIGQSSQIGAGETPRYAASTLFSDTLRLFGYDLSAVDVEPGDSLKVTLVWQAEQATAENWVVFVHLLDQGGVLVAQHDGEPNAGQYPTSAWVVGEPVRDAHVLELPESLPAGEYRLVMGMYRWPSLERLTVAELDGSHADMLVLSQPIRVRAR